MNLTKEEFWQNFWNELPLPQVVNRKFKNDNVISKFFIDYIPKGSESKKAIEIGCAPGKWMAFVHGQLEYNISGVEYLDAAGEKTKENLRFLEMNGEVFIADFFNFHTSSLSSPTYLDHF